MQALTFTPMSSAGGLSLRDVKAPTSVDDGRGGLAKLSNNCTYLPACLPTCLPTCDALEIPRTWAEPMRPMHSAAAACIEKRDAPLMLTRSLAHSLTHARTHSLTHSLAHSPTHPLTHPQAPSAALAEALPSRSPSTKTQLAPAWLGATSHGVGYRGGRFSSAKIRLAIQWPIWSR
jgi:hypothetical protein